MCLTYVQQGHGVVPRGVSQVQVQDATDDAGVVC